MLEWLFPVQRCCCAPEASERPWSKSHRVADSLNPPGPDDVNSTAAEFLVESRKMWSGLPVGPADRMVPTYATTEHEVLQGEPLYFGSILQLTLGESIHEMRMAIHVNGFSLTPSDSLARGQTRGLCRAWSPFSLVEKCQVKTMQHSAYWAVFKLTVFRREGQDRCYYFATTGGSAYKDRDKWVAEMVTAISNVTVSLFPPHAITVQPIQGIATTSTRIMAGYLLQSGHEDSVSLFYCELHAYSGGEARLAVYKDEWCQQEVMSVPLQDSSTVSTRKGTYCTVFGIDQHRFCARTREEKDLWLRAVSNIKVKLMFDAPDPTHEELSIFRAAVHERIEELKGAGDIQSDPLLASVPRAPPMSPRGDAFDPEPIDEDTLDQVSELDPQEVRRLPEDKLVKALEPEDCRRLLRTVSNKMSESSPGGGVFNSRPSVELVRVPELPMPSHSPAPNPVSREHTDRERLTREPTVEPNAAGARELITEGYGGPQQGHPVSTPGATPQDLSCFMVCAPTSALPVVEPNSPELSSPTEV